MEAAAVQIAVSKKRKRTGKAREEAKKAALAALAEKEVENPTERAAKDEQDAEVEGDIATQRREVDPEDVAKRIPRAIKAVHPLFKQGRTFEVRRIVKKVKFLRSKGGNQDEVKSLEDQLAVLSHLSLNDTIASHLLTKLQKHHQFKHTALPSSITSQLKTSAQASTSAQSELLGKVENRLCSNKSVSEGVKNALGWMMMEKGAKLPSSSASVKQRASNMENARETKQLNELPPADHAARPSRTNIASLDDADEGDMESLDEEAIAADEAGWESGSVSDVPPISRPRIANSDSDSDVGEEDGEEEEEDEDEHTTVLIARPNKTSASTPAKKTKPNKAPVTSSTFLPSLSTGFIMGDSDSDPDLDPDVDGAGVVGNKAVRKNRRGQRARQAIWEKKFGKHAKHVVARERAEEDAQRAVQARAMRGRGRGRGAPFGSGMRDEGRGLGHHTEQDQPDRGAASLSRASRGVRGSRGMGRGGPFGGHDAYSHGQAPAQQTKSTGVHPSWEAARMKKREMGAVKPQGTKIVFD
ncbi:Bud-site selection protein [Kockovaella imperatae]|uniref:Bud-site selection protein n=1 Tax=Kockovaella imperatae TaxID=4999 RepID=A0A1Y1UE82_9TREE|nr:Bud-site selection protein [Kockovaella imperatae]ORX36361.1 Bud-site selection protein [Kockovaella imperatae]